MLCANRWLGVRLELIGNLLVFVIASLSVVLSHSVATEHFKVMLGVALVSAFQITGILNFLVRQV